jgi:hypothetical protein
MSFSLHPPWVLFSEKRQHLLRQNAGAGEARFAEIFYTEPFFIEWPRTWWRNDFL